MFLQRGHRLRRPSPVVASAFAVLAAFELSADPAGELAGVGAGAAACAPGLPSASTFAAAGISVGM